jgi:hypothetical protein
MALTRHPSRLPLRTTVILFVGVGCGIGVVLLAVRWWTQPELNYSLIEEGLYQGGVVASPPPGTTAVLNLSETADTYQAEIHLWEPIRDAEPAPDIDWLRRMVRFVEEQRRAGRTTYVHCLNGVSRSGMVMVAYQMAKNGWTRDEAVRFVQSKRPITRPNPAFMQLLLDWERALKE